MLLAYSRGLYRLQSAFARGLSLQHRFCNAGMLLVAPYQIRIDQRRECLCPTPNGSFTLLQCVGRNNTSACLEETALLCKPAHGQAAGCCIELQPFDQSVACLSKDPNKSRIVNEYATVRQMLSFRSLSSIRGMSVYRPWVICRLSKNCSINAHKSSLTLHWRELSGT